MPALQARRHDRGDAPIRFALPVRALMALVRKAGRRPGNSVGRSVSRPGTRGQRPGGRWLLAGVLGRIVAQKSGRTRLYDVKDSGRRSATASALGDRSRTALSHRRRGSGGRRPASDSSAWRRRATAVKPRHEPRLGSRRVRARHRRCSEALCAVSLDRQADIGPRRSADEQPRRASPPMARRSAPAYYDDYIADGHSLPASRSTRGPRRPRRLARDRGRPDHRVEYRIEQASSNA